MTLEQLKKAARPLTWGQRGLLENEGLDNLFAINAAEGGDKIVRKVLALVLRGDDLAAVSDLRVGDVYDLYYDIVKRTYFKEDAEIKNS